MDSQQRVKKTVGATTSLFMYDESGQLLGEYDSAGGALYETVYLDEQPVAVLKPAVNTSGYKAYYIYADHLNTPRLVTDNAAGTANKKVWQWDSDPFGITQPNENPAAAGVFTYNPRFPGQVYDKETGLHYNYFRDYNPGTGRYVQSDPIGLAGGMNTFGYVGGNPLMFIDPTGLICEYSQSGRIFICTNAAGQTYASCTGYSGNGQGLNNPAAQNQPNVGPLPQGSYIVGGTTNRRGPNTRPLIPDPSNNMYGRAGFLLHGDNSALNNTASEGCIIIPPQCRTAVPVGETVVVRP